MKLDENIKFDLEHLKIRKFGTPELIIVCLKLSILETGLPSHGTSKTIQVLTRHGSNFLPRDSQFDSNDLKTTDGASVMTLLLYLFKWLLFAHNTFSDRTHFNSTVSFLRITSMNKKSLHFHG